MRNQLISKVTIYPDDRDPNINISYPLKEGENIIGSSFECDIRLSYPSIAEMHAKIMLTNGKFTIEDLGSSLGTYRMSSDNPRQKLKAGREYELEVNMPFYLANKYKCIIETWEKGINKFSN